MIRWFASEKPKPAGQDIQQSKQPSTHTSLGFNALFHQIRPGKKYNILDLGRAFPENVEFFSQFPCKIYIEDLYETLNTFDYLSPEDGFSLETVYRYLLPYPKETQFDVILTWDLFNYLERDEFRHLIRHLSRHCHPGTLLFSLISTLKHIPEKPIFFKIVDTERLLYEPNSSVLRPCPRYQQSDLNEVLSRFRVCNSFILRNGFKEYLFIRE